MLLDNKVYLRSNFYFASIPAYDICSYLLLYDNDLSFLTTVRKVVVSRAKVMVSS